MPKSKSPMSTDPTMDDEIPTDEVVEDEAVETDVVEDDVVEDEPEDEPEPRIPAEERIPKSRLDEANRRADALERALEAIRSQGQPQPQMVPVQQLPQVDPDEGLTPEAKNWAKFIRRVAEPEIEKRVAQRMNQFETERVNPLQRDNVVVQDMLDDQNIRRKFKDYHLYEQAVNDLRQQWFRDSGGQIRAPREYAYAVAKLQRGQFTEPTARANTARAKAKGGATTEQRTPGRKVAPKTTLNMDDIANMSEKELEQALRDVKF